MNKIQLDNINKYIVKPIYIQVAFDKKWDEAWKIYLDRNKPSDIDISTYTNKGGRNLAFELFFETIWGGKFLFGSYFSQSLKTKSWDDFLGTVIDCAFNNSQIPSQTITDIGINLIEKPKLFSRPCTAVILGILDYWRFYEPCVLLHINNSTNNLDVNKKLAKYPHLKNNKHNTQLLEFVCDYNPLHFIGFTVGNKQDTDFILDTLLTNNLIIKLLS